MTAAAFPALARLEQAAAIVYHSLAPTPQYAWPLLSQEIGCEVWVKHENHTPIGAFKVRGGLVYMHELLKREPQVRGVVSATRGNHGQSIGYAARKHGLTATLVVPRGNSVEKNAAMRALGVELIEAGEDFQAAREYAQSLAQSRALHMVPSFHLDLVSGVASYSLEFLRAVPKLDAVFVPIGLGSGICGMISARAALGAGAEIIGVVSAGAPAYALSFRAGKSVSHEVTTELADGLACRVPDDQALAWIRQGAARVLSVSDAEIAAAMRLYYSATHNLAEGAGAAALAALAQERERWRGKRVGVVLSGANVDREVFGKVLAAA